MSQLLIVTGATLAALGLLRLVLRMGWLGAKRSGGALRIVETAALGPRQRLHLVEVGGERLVVAATDATVTLVHRLEAARTQPAPAPERAPASPAAAPARAGRWQRLMLGALATWMLIGLLPGAALAQPGAASELPGAIAELVKADRISGTLQIVLLLTALSLAPSILLMATCFTRFIIVFSLLRQAVGLPQVPPNPVLAGLALFLTLFVMAPVGQQISEEAVAPYAANQLSEREALAKAEAPVRSFLLSQTRAKDLALFRELSREPGPEDPTQASVWTLLPAFMISEMRTAFEIGFVIYLPFLVIDLVVASMLISMGMIVLPPAVISLPFKLMLFVLLDGWNLVVGGLAGGFR